VGISQKLYGKRPIVTRLADVGPRCSMVRNQFDRAACLHLLIRDGLVRDWTSRDLIKPA